MMGKLNIPPIDIGIGNDFKIKITQITDDAGEVLDFKEVYLGIEWIDCGGVKYTTIWDSNGECQNTKLVDGELYLIFNRSVHSFRYPGKLRYQIFSKVLDNDFIDNAYNVNDTIEISNINLITL